MKKTKTQLPPVKYSLNRSGCFTIENYNQSKAFSNFFPGIAGLWGIPMWVFYVNRGQCITSFGIEAKDKAIMEFQPANKSYRLTSLQGFRTFVRAYSGKKEFYWEPFQNYLRGTDFKKTVKLHITSHDLTIEEINHDLGLSARVNYFTLPEESCAALVRRLTIVNVDKKRYDIDVIDGLPMIVPFGLNDGLNKNISRTVEAWVKVRNLKNKAPFYQLNVEVSDTPKVTYVEEGNFYFCFDPQAPTEKLFDPIVQASCIFGRASDFIAPEKFFNGKFSIPLTQQTSNRTSSAMSFIRATLKPGMTKEIISLLGYAYNVEHLNKIVSQATQDQFITKKARRNREVIDEIKNYTLTQTASGTFNLYSSQTFLDNILRGGLPISIKTKRGHVSLNVYSRKHGDLERDYNYFVVAPTYYSQGNGNYRDVNQNRRNDVWFNKDVQETHVVNFLNLIQADGYNPLVVKGTTFLVKDKDALAKVLKKVNDEALRQQLDAFLKFPFLPGSLLEFIEQNSISLKISLKDFLGQILELCHRQELADHQEGYWSDHWTYNMDMIESYLSIYPEKLKDLLLDQKVFTFYLNTHYVLPREKRYILTPHGVRQYHSVHADESIDPQRERRLKEKDGQGSVYQTHLMGKLLCLIANKAATLDPSGIGIEMEADKPNWYDSLNGLPGLLGSALSETLELKRMSQFLLESLKQMSVKENRKVLIFEELATFISGLTNILSLESDNLSYWTKANDIKEHYRQRVRRGIEGAEKEISIAEIKNFLKLVIAKAEKSFSLAHDSKGYLATYFYHEVTEYEVTDKSQESAQPQVWPLKFKRHTLPQFLEGYVHALRVAASPMEAKKLYEKVKSSDLYDKKLKMYKVNANLSRETEEIGRTRIFPSGWLENESVWLHMEYKFVLELLKHGLAEEFYDNFKHVLVPFLNPKKYGRSITENSSFLVSSAHEDESLHGQGFVARLSGSTAEFLHIWLMMNVGKNPFTLNGKNELVLTFKPALPKWLFTKTKAKIKFFNLDGQWKNIELPPKTYAFNFLGSILVVYHNSKRKNIYGKNISIKEIRLTYPERKRPVVISSASIPAPHSTDIRERKVERIDVYFS